MLKHLKCRWGKRLESQVQSFVEVWQKKHPEGVQPFKEINQNKNARYKSHVFQLQIPGDLYVSLVRYVDNVTNPVIQTQSVPFAHIFKMAYQCHIPLNSNSLSFSWWIELKLPVHTFEKYMVLSLHNYILASLHVASVSFTVPLRPASACPFSRSHLCLHQCHPLLTSSPLNEVWRLFLVHPPPLGASHCLWEMISEGQASLV